MSNNLLLLRLRELLVAAGVCTAVESMDYTLHSLRVGCVEYLLSQGLSAEKIAKFIGWRTMDMVIRYVCNSSVAQQLATPLVQIRQARNTELAGRGRLQDVQH